MNYDCPNGPWVELVRVAYPPTVQENVPFTLRIEYRDPVDAGVAITVDAPTSYLTLEGAAPPWAGRSAGGVLELTAVLKNPLCLVTVTLIDGCRFTASSSGTVKIANRPPVFTTAIAPTAGTVGAGRSLFITLFASDPDPVDTVSWSYSLFPADAGTFGPTTAGTPGAAVFIASPTYTGSATVTARIEDPQGAFATSSGQVTVTNSPPTFYGALTVPTTSARGSAETFTADGRDPDLQTLEYEWTITGPAGGSFSVPTGQWTTAPSGTYTVGSALGQVSVSVKVRDPFGLEASAPLSASFPVLNRPPVVSFTSDGGVVARGGTLVVVATATDPDGDPLTLSWDGGALGAVTATGGAGTATFTAGSSFGVAEVSLTVTDALDASVSAGQLVSVGRWRTLGDAGFSASEAARPHLAFDLSNVPWIAYDDGFALDAGVVVVRRFEASTGSWLPVSPGVLPAPRGLAFALVGSTPVLGVIEPAEAVRVFQYQASAWSELLGPAGAGRTAGSSLIELALAEGPAGPAVALRATLSPFNAAVRTWTGTAWEWLPVSGGASASPLGATSLRLARESGGGWALAYSAQPGNGPAVTSLASASGAWSTAYPFSPGSGLVLDLASGPSGTSLASLSGGKLVVFRRAPGGSAWLQLGAPASFGLGVFGAAAISIADDGVRPWVAGYDGDGLSVLRFDEGRSAWERFGPLGLGAGATAVPRAHLVFDRTGAPCVAYFDAPNAGLTVACAQ